MKIYYDVDQNEYITEKQLFREYSKAKSLDGTIDYDFNHYISNCLTINNGSLYTKEQRIKQLEKQVINLETEQTETGYDNTSDINIIIELINPPELEIVKKEENNDIKNEEIKEEKQPEQEEDKSKEIKNEVKEENKENENIDNNKNKEENNDKGVKIAIKEADLDELD